MIIFVVAVTTALVVSFLCSILESVLLSVTPARVEALAVEGRKAGTMLKSFKQHIDVPISAILIVNTIAHTVGATVAGASYVDVFGDQTLWVFSLVFTVAVLLFTEIIPKTLGVAFSARLAAPVAYSIRYLTLALGPLVTLASMISRSLRPTRGAAVTSVEDIRLLAAIGRTEGVLGARTARIIDSATRLHELAAADVLLPRNKVVLLTGIQSRAEIIETVQRSGHSRFPFTPTGEVDDVSGVVFAKELLLAVYEHPEEISWADLVREPILIPETKPLNALLQEFRDERRHMAFVVDEYGSVQGIVTLEDVLEELVGDILDESDRPVVEIVEQADGTLQVLATVEMRKLCTRLGIVWDTDETVVTLGGFIATTLDRIPQAGDTLVWKNHRLDVIAASRNRAEVVRVARLGTEARG
jgi:CBS domain containing-hemolysin-like protein